MATYYLDFVNGNDASAGTSWATAWKTLNNGATAARIAPGDEIRIAKTADPTSIGNGTWTSKSATVTLASAQTTNIYLDGAWTAANSGATTTSTTRKEGTNSSQITTSGTTATSTKYAYLTVGGAGGLNLSSYDSITFWIQNTNAIVANNYQIKLCSDTTGDTAVDTFDIPAIPSNSEWVPLTLTRVGGGALGNAIKSIAWYTGTVSPGNSRKVLLDNILGCNVSGLNLQSIISKSSSAFTATETWHGLQSINGTTVILGNENQLDAGSTSLRGYFTLGTSTETVTTYIINTYKFAMSADDITPAQPLQDSGTTGNLITYSGGWDTASNTQNGMTWIDGINCKGYGIAGIGKDYWKVQRMGLVRFRISISNDGPVRTGCEIIDVVSINCYNSQLQFKDSIITHYSNNMQAGFSLGSTAINNIVNITTQNNNTGPTTQNDLYQTLKIYNSAGNLSLSSSTLIIDLLDYQDCTGGITTGSGNNILIKDATVKNCTASTTLTNVSKLVINKLTASGNTNLGTSTVDLQVKQLNAATTQIIGSGVSASSGAVFPTASYSNINNIVTDNRIFWRYGNALSQTTTRKSSTGIAWQINITNTAQNTRLPFNFPIARVACNANALVTVKAWVKLSHATDIGAKLMIQAGEIAGVSTDITASKSADTNWEELTITFTPTIAGVAQIYVQGYWLANLADESIYVDDITITQA